MQLQNQEIWLAYPNLIKLSKIKFPVKVGLGIATLAVKLQQAYTVIEHERSKLVRHYGVLDAEKKTMVVDSGSPEAGDFAREFGELLTEYWEDDIQFKRVKLPPKVTETCKECGKKTDVNFLIEPQTLLPLKEKFVEI